MTPEEPVTYALLGSLAIALLAAGLSDWRHRLIGNRLNAAIALGAPLFWLASGLHPWPGIAAQLALAGTTFAIGAALFACRALGGGDVKLLAALALWVPPALFGRLVVATALVGGLLALALLLARMRRPGGAPVAVPYGIAIAAATLWVLPALGG